MFNVVKSSIVTALLVITSTAPSLTQATEVCRSAIAPNSCKYYLCEENLYRFGRSGYFLAFGHPYCSSFFNDVTHRVGPEGQAWLTRVGQCLQEKLSKRLYDGTESRSKVIEIAIASHAECYLETGACDVPVSDLSVIASTFMNELANPKIAAESIKFLYGCANKKWNSF